MVARDALTKPLEAGDYIAWSQPEGAGSTQMIGELVEIEHRRLRNRSDRPGRTKTLRCDEKDSSFFYAKVIPLWSTRRSERPWNWNKINKKPNELRVTDNIIKLDQSEAAAFLALKGVL